LHLTERGSQVRAINADTEPPKTNKTKYSGRPPNVVIKPVRNARDATVNKNKNSQTFHDWPERFTYESFPIILRVQPNWIIAEGCGRSGLLSASIKILGSDGKVVDDGEVADEVLQLEAVGLVLVRFIVDNYVSIYGV